jgi:exonuclease SbcD
MAKEITGEDLPIIYVGHAAIMGTDFTGHQKQNDRFIGGIECTKIEQLGSLYDYVALGHIHKAQTFGEGRARYCGTPLAVSFDEVRSGYEHGFDVVEIESHGAMPVIRTVEVENLHPLVNIPAEGFATWDEVIKELKQYPADIDSYLRLNILLPCNDLLPYNKDAQIQTALEGKMARYAAINPTREDVAQEEKQQDNTFSLTMEELQNIDHKQVLTEYAKNSGIIFTEEFEEMFNTVYATVNNQDYEN